MLANLLALVKDGQLQLTGTDLEVDMIARCVVEESQDGECTIPARTWFEIVRALPDGGRVTLTNKSDQLSVQGGRSRCSLVALQATELAAVGCVLTCPFSSAKVVRCPEQFPPV